MRSGLRSALALACRRVVVKVRNFPRFLRISEDERKAREERFKELLKGRETPEQRRLRLLQEWQDDDGA